ncbi:hypothetical protein KR51_00019110 [Rubidibacter lacunae KORDI 51-2]|uniref:Uncharacterized protein n=1 Tax=Rubidibacter lacunae KORDI 51-2 TaxID=582515 RepID=U5DL91_9CHRO|nr:hypothetical protein KR51_00019110 [Rubidibacter lacunae KORDI 51-2]
MSFNAGYPGRVSARSPLLCFCTPSRSSWVRPLLGRNSEAARPWNSLSPTYLLASSAPRGVFARTCGIIFLEGDMHPFFQVIINPGFYDVLPPCN